MIWSGTATTPAQLDVVLCVNIYRSLTNKRQNSMEYVKFAEELRLNAIEAIKLKLRNSKNNRLSVHSEVECWLGGGYVPYIDEIVLIEDDVEYEAISSTGVHSTGGTIKASYDDEDDDDILDWNDLEDIASVYQICQIADQINKNDKEYVGTND